MSCLSFVCISYAFGGWGRGLIIWIQYITLQIFHPSFKILLKYFWNFSKIWAFLHQHFQSTCLKSLDRTPGNVIRNIVMKKKKKAPQKFSKITDPVFLYFCTEQTTAKKLISDICNLLNRLVHQTTTKSFWLFKKPESI